jgi:endonuclease/exonuclease/phosphatase family metal-dependent hydrolase
MYVLTYNVQGVSILNPFAHGREVARLRKLARAVLKSGADVVCLQECFSALTWRTLVAALAGGFPFHTDPTPVHWLSRITSGLLIMSRCPILEWGYFDFFNRPVWWNHWDGFGLMDRGLLWARIRVYGGRDVAVINTHLSPRGRAVTRTRECEEIRDVAGELAFWGHPDEMCENRVGSYRVKQHWHPARKTLAARRADYQRLPTPHCEGGTQRYGTHHAPPKPLRVHVHEHKHSHKHKHKYAHAAVGRAERSEGPSRNTERKGFAPERFRSRVLGCVLAGDFNTETATHLEETFEILGDPVGGAGAEPATYNTTGTARMRTDFGFAYEGTSLPGFGVGTAEAAALNWRHSDHYPVMVHVRFADDTSANYVGAGADAGAGGQQGDVEAGTGD